MRYRKATAEKFRPDHPQQYSEVNFLKNLRRKEIKIVLNDGASIIARLKGWGRFHLFIERIDKGESMVFKQCIREIGEYATSGRGQ